MIDTSISNQIYLSRDNIRTQIIEYLQTYLDLKNVDLLKSSYLSFIVNILATLTSNLMFYEISTYREFFLTTAQLDESILNLAAFLGYSPGEASYSIVDVLMTIPFGFEDSRVVITIPSGFTFTAGNVKFITDYVTTITVTNNQTATVLVQDGQKVFNLPLNITPSNFSFLLVGKQYQPSQQQFQIDQDLPLYQFVTINVPISGQAASIIVQIQQPGSSSWTTFTEFDSLYLMSATDNGFVSRRTSDGITLYFGNGVMGVQPVPGSTVQVTINETLGESGNIIAGAITQGDRIYLTTGAGVTKLLNYTAVNAAPSTGGKDEESSQDVRANSIANLTALKRLVSESDYQNTEVVIPAAPITPGSLPVLKRSDLKVNEIQLYTILLFGADVVPTRNASYIVSDEVSYIPRNTIVQVDDIDYYTLFDMTIDYINKIANYQYIMYEVVQLPVLVTSYGSTYNIVITSLDLSKVDNTAVLTLPYYSSEIDATSCECQIMFLEAGTTFQMTNDSQNSKFIYTFDPYTLIPTGAITIYFTIIRNGASIAQYSTTLTFRTDVSDFMMSNVQLGSDSTSLIEIGVDSSSIIVYDIPVIQKAYYDAVDKVTFESQVLQSILSSIEFGNVRMITDFTNIKLANTTGILKDMQLNTVSKSPVIDIDLLSLPAVSSLGDRYIVGGNEGGLWEGQKRGMIAECIDEVSQTWGFFSSVEDDIVYVSNKGKKYIYSEGEWVVPEYQLPLEILLEVYMASNYSGSALDLQNAIVSTIITTFTPRFGANISLYRSEIIDVVQDVTGVDHCRLVKPESSIFYDFDLDNLTQRELLAYGPEYIYFNENNITVQIL